MRELRDRLQAYSDTQAANRDADGLIKEQAATTRELEARLRGLGPAGVSPAAQRAIVALEGRVRELEGEVERGEGWDGGAGSGGGVGGERGEGWWGGVGGGRWGAECGGWEGARLRWCREVERN